MWVAASLFAAGDQNLFATAFDDDKYYKAPPPSSFLDATRLATCNSFCLLSNFKKDSVGGRDRGKTFKLELVVTCSCLEDDPEEPQL